MTTEGRFAISYERWTKEAILSIGLTRHCRVSGKLATANCPPDEVQHKFFDLYPTANGQWVRSTKDPQPPTAYCDVHTGQ